MVEPLRGGGYKYTKKKILFYDIKVSNEMEAFTSTNLLTNWLICPHNALESFMKLVPRFRACFLNGQNLKRIVCKKLYIQYEKGYKQFLILK